MNKEQLHTIFAAHFPGKPILPGVCIMQYALEHAEKTLHAKLQLMEARNVKFLATITPETIEDTSYEVKTLKLEDDKVTLLITVKDKEKTYAKMTMACKITTPANGNQAANQADNQAESQADRLHSRGICVVIPTYNNAGTILNVVRRSLRQCHDVIVVNDGCTDNTADILASVHGITVVTLPKNSGKGIALKAGFRKALAMGFAYAITLDADGQHFPEDIPLLLQANISHPHSIIIGERKNLDSQERSGGSKFANAFSNFWFCVQTGRRLKDTQTGYRLYPLHRLHGLSLLTSRYEAELELLVFSAWHGVDIIPQPVNVYYPPRAQRISHFRPAYDFTRIFILNTILCFLAIGYGLPLALLRLCRTTLYTIYSLLFFLFWCLFYLLPASSLYVMLQRNQEKCTWGLHRILCFLGRLVFLWHGIPGVKCRISNPHGEDYTRPAVIICNHQSPLDLMAMLAQSPHLTILTKDWVYHNPFFGFALRHAEYYPVTDGIDNIMPRLTNLTKRGYSIAVYPEGTRSADLSIQRFRKGAFRIARELQLDIIPIIEYAPGKALPKGGKHLRQGVFHVEIDKRIPYSEYSKLGEDKDIASWFRRYYRKRYSELSDLIDREYP